MVDPKIKSELPLKRGEVTTSLQNLKIMLPDNGVQEVGLNLCVGCELLWTDLFFPLLLFYV